jgi:2-C-methyl-D-erythritol 4-phosphate cytidylyltransferase
VPLCHDDADAPAGCAALRELGGRPLLIRVVIALQRSSAVGQVVVAVPPGTASLVAGLLVDADRPVPDAGRAPVEVFVVPENGHGHQVLAVLRAMEVPAGRPIVVHDPLFPLAPTALISSVVAALPGRADAGPEVCVAAVPVRSVTDTLKWVDGGGVVLGTADRERFRTVLGPQAFWPVGLQAVLEAAGSEQLRGTEVEALPRLVRAGTGRLVPVLAEGGPFRIRTSADLALAEAMLQIETAMPQIEGDDAGARREGDLRQSGGRSSPAVSRPAPGQGDTSP